MRKLIVSEFLSFDGVMQAPGGVDEDTDGGFAHGAWFIPYWHDDIGGYFTETLSQCDTLLLGRKTYETYARAWPPRAGVDGYADRMNSIPKHVVSTTLTRPAWHNSTVISEDIATAIDRLKAQPGGDILVFGSGKLVVYLMQHDLVDEYHLLIYPVVLGHGQRLFPTGSSMNLQRIASQLFPSGVMGLLYRSALLARP